MTSVLMSNGSVRWRRCFSSSALIFAPAELQELSALSGETQILAFFRPWVQKEACLKPRERSHDSTELRRGWSIAQRDSPNNPHRFA